MQFLSSKLVHQLETAFAYVLDGTKVKEGEQLLEKSRQEEQFELALATFISRSEVYHQRLLAILQLQKQLIIENTQTMWSLRQVYFKDSDKIAQKICRLVTSRENIKLASDFLKVDVYQTGASNFRQIEIIFNLVKTEEKAKCTTQFHYQLILDYFLTVIKLLDSDEDCFFFVVVSLALFYSASLEYDADRLTQLAEHWRQIEGKCCSSENAEVFVIVSVIKNLVLNQVISPKSNAFYNFLNATFTSTNALKMDYLCKGLSFIMKYGDIVANQQLRSEFIEAILSLAQFKQKEMLLNIKMSGEIEICFDQDIDIDNSNDHLIRSICKDFIQELFSKQYSWFTGQYLQKYQHPDSALEALLAILNCYDSIQLHHLSEMVSSFVERVMHSLKQRFAIIATGKLTKTQLNRCITFIEFLTKYKTQLELTLLPSIVSVLLEGSKVCVTLAPFCDAFLSQIWKQLTFLQYNDLTNFMELHLEQINNNQWAVRFKSYECFLNLAIYIQQTFRHFSSCTEEDGLLLSILNSHSIICEILRENTSLKLNFELFHLFIAVTKSIIDNPLFKRSSIMYQRMNIPLLVDKIEKHLFLDENTAVIVACHRYHSKILMQCLEEERRDWLIDELDSAYRIELYLRQIEYASQWLAQQQVESIGGQLGVRIISFLKQLSVSQLQKIKTTKLWDNLQTVYNINSHLTEMMEIQSS